MEKINDFLAAQLNAPEDFTLLDFYKYGLTPNNTGLKDADYYKGIDKVVERFSDEDGKFNEAAFNQFYDSARRAYNEWANTDFADTIVKSIARSPEDISRMNDRNVWDTSTKVFEVNDMWRHQRGFGNLRETGKESYDYREVAQANRVHDADDNVLDYTPNDKGGLFKALSRKPMYIATDENGVPLLDPTTGDPYYKELRDGESSYGKDMLHYSDTLTREDTWLNKYDFFDNDGLDKSAAGTIARTVIKVAPYLIPYVGPALGAIGAVYGLAKSLPTLAKAINGIVTHDSDSTEFGKQLNNTIAFFSQFDTTKSRHSIEHQWSFENIGDMIVTSAKQLFEQRTFTRIPEILKLPSTKFNTGLFGSMSLGYMALTSAESSLETFKRAGMSDTSAGIAMLAYTGAMFGLMQSNYFKGWLFKNTWVNAEPEITGAIKKQSDAVADGIMQSVKSSAKGERLLKLAPTATKEESEALFKRIFKATKEAWTEKTFAPIRALDITIPGSVNAAKTTGGVYIHHALNEGIEEVMEEQALDIIKLISMGLENLGYNISDSTHDQLDFGLTWNDAIQRYATSFVGGAIGGAVFQGLDDWHTKVLNNNISKYTGRGVDGELTRAIRLYGKDRVIKELDRLHKRGLANENLAMSGKWVKDPTDASKEVWTWDEKGDKQSQNDVVYNALKIKINALAEVMQRNNLLLTDEEVLRKVLTKEQFEQFQHLDNPVIQQLRKEVKEGAQKENITEQEYRKRHHINNFEEFAKRTGFADIILTDFGNIALDIVELDQDIEGRKGYLTAQFPDTRSSERDEAIKKDPFIKDLEEKKKQKQEQLDALYSGKAASYYIRYAHYASHSGLVSTMISATGPNVLSKESFAFLRHHTTYSDADENEKKVIDKEYEAYIKSQGIDALERSNELFQYAQDLFAPVLKQQLGEIVGTNLTSDIYADTIENDENADPSILLDRAIAINPDAIGKEKGKASDIFQNLYGQIDVLINSGLDENGNALTIGQRYHKLLDMAINSYKAMKEKNIVGLESDDFIKYAFKAISQDLQRRMSRVPVDVNTFIANTPAINDFDQFIASKTDEEIIKLLQDDARFTQEVEDLKNARDDEESDEIRAKIEDKLRTERNNFVRENKFFDKKNTAIYSDTVNRYKDILENLYQNPEKAVQLIAQFEQDLDRNIAKDPTAKQAVMDMFNIDLLKTVAQKVQQAVDISKTLKLTPTIDLAKVLTFSLMGTENPLLDIIANERAALAQKGVTDYFYSNQFNKIQLEMAENILPVVRGVIFAANSGMNESANEMLQEEGAELLPVIPKDVAYIYKNDLDFLESQLLYLRGLHERNQGLKEREHILVRKNFYRNIINFFTQETDDGEPVKILQELQKVLGDFNFKETVEELGLLTYDFDDNSKENQVKLMTAFQEFEHKLFKHVEDKKLNLGTVSYNVYKSFNDIYKMKNGILSKNEDDTLQNFDIATYLISVLGVDSYWFGNKLKKRFGEEGKKPFFGQELAIRLICLNFMHPEMVNDAVEAIRDSTEAALDDGRIIPENPNDETNKRQNAKYLLAKTKLYNTVIIDGFAGCGKSTVIHNIALSFFDGVNEVAVSKIRARAEGMGLDSDHTYSLNELMAKLLGIDTFVEKDYMNKGDSYHTHVWAKPDAKINFDAIFGKPTDGELRVLTIDECTLVKEGIWTALTKAAREQNVHIIGLGNLMQAGETSATGISAGLDDCFGIFSTKLTVSMRNANSGQSANDDALGRNVAKLVDAKKDKPGWTESLALSDVTTPDVMLQFGFTPDKKLAGTQIVTQIDDTLIDGTISSLSPGESILIVTPDGTFEALREKYKDNENVRFVTVENAPGDEADYVILNEKFGIVNPNNRFSMLQKAYTLLTRSRKGTKVVNSIGLQGLRIFNANESPTATIDISFDPNSNSAKEYVDTKLAALNTIPGEAEPEPAAEEKKQGEEPKKPEPAKPVYKHPQESSNFADETKTVEEVADELQPVLEQEAENATDDELAQPATPAKDDFNGDEALGVGLKGLKLRAFKQYLALKGEHHDASILDTEDFSNWIEGTPFGELTPYHPFGQISNPSEQVTTAFKEFLLGLSGIILNHKPGTWSSVFNMRAQNLHRNELFGINSKFITAFEESLQNKTGVLFKRPFNDKMILYYCFDGYALPIGIYTPVDSDLEQGFIKITDDLFKQETSIIPITSKGEKRASITSVLPKSIHLANLDGFPVTAVFMGSDAYEPNRRNEFFASHSKGHAYAMLLHEFGMSAEEVREIFTAPEENGLYKYFLNDDPNLYSIAGVQYDAHVDKLLNILSYLNHLSHGNVDGDENLNAVKEVAAFFGYDEDKVRSDFREIYAIESGENYRENAERFKTIRSEYNILYSYDVDRFISALFSYFSKENPDKLSYFTQNLIFRTGVYSTRVNAEELRYRGFHFGLKPDRDYLNFYIIPSSSGNNTFDIYYTGTARSGDKSQIIGTISWNDLFKGTAEFGNDLKSIVEALLNVDGVKQQVESIRSDFSADSVYDYVENNSMMFSLSTAIPEGDNALRFYSPFEGEIVTLLLNQDRELMVDGDSLDTLVKTSNIFKYGVFRHIGITKQIIESQKLWATGNVKSENLTWDIVKVLAPLYSMNFSKKPDNLEELSLERTYDKLLEKQVDQSGLTDLQLNGYQINFTRNGKSVSVPLSNEIRELLGDVVGRFRTLDQIEVSDNTLKFTISDGNNTRIVTVSEVQDPKELLYKLLKNFNGSDQIKNGRFGTIRTEHVYDYDGKPIELVQVSKTNQYQLKVGNKYYNFENHGSLKTNSGDYYLYLSSEAFGDKDIIHRIKTDSNKDPLFDNSKTFLGSSGFMHYYSTPAGIFEQDWSTSDRTLHKVNLIFTSDSNFKVNVEGVESEISFDTFTDEGKALIQRDPLQIRFKEGTTINKGSDVWIIKGELTAPMWFLRQISSYDGTSATGKITSINFKKRTIRINRSTYNLNQNVDKEFLSNKLSQLFVENDLISWLSAGLSVFKPLINDFDEVVKELSSSEDPIESLNNYLNDNKELLNGSFTATLSDNGAITITQDSPAKDAILKEVIKLKPESKYRDYNVTIDNAIGNKQTFSVYTQDGNLLYQGEITLNGDDWKVTLLTPADEVDKEYDFNEWLNRIPLDQIADPYITIAKKKLYGRDLTSDETSLWVAFKKAHRNGTYLENSNSFVELISWYDAWHKAQEPKCNVI